VSESEGSAPPPRERNRPSLALGRLRPALVAVLLLAAGLRFTALSWGVRHTPYQDETVFVQNVARMAARGDLDQRFYEYPGLFFYLLLPVFRLAGARLPAGPELYVLARAVVAGFGVASVGLVYLLGTRIGGPRLGLIAALLLAVSPLDVETAHMVRPDVVLQAFVILAFLALLRVGRDVAGDVVAGLAIGAATAVKFSGALLVPSYLARRFLTPGPRRGRIALVGLIAVAVVTVLTPYALLHRAAYGEGVRTQWWAHYGRMAVAAHFGRWLAFYLGEVARTIGPLGVVLALAGCVLVRREWYTWLPMLLHTLTSLVVFSTADIRYERHMVPTLAVVVLLAAKGIDTLGKTGARVMLLALATAVVPFVESVAYLRSVGRPSGWDRALDWINANVPPDAVIVNSYRSFGLDHTRFEVVPTRGIPRLDRLLALHADVYVAPPDAENAADFREVFRAPADRYDPALAVYAVPASVRPVYREVDLRQARMTASENAADVRAVLGDRPHRSWFTARPQRPGQWFEVELASPVMLAKVELALGEHPARYPRRFWLLGTLDGQGWRRIQTLSVTPSFEEQMRRGSEVREILIFEPTLLRAIRLVQVGNADRRWGITRLRLSAVAGAAGPEVRSRDQAPPASSPAAIAFP
jgi:hypothetical protein